MKDWPTYFPGYDAWRTREPDNPKDEDGHCAVAEETGNLFCLSCAYRGTEKCKDTEAANE